MRERRVALERRYRKALARAVGPMHHQAFDLGIRAKPDQHTRIIGGQVAAVGANAAPNGRRILAANFHTSPVRIAFYGDEPQPQPWIRGTDLVTKDAQRAVG